MVIKSLIIFWLEKKIFSSFFHFVFIRKQYCFGAKTKQKNVSHSVKLSVLDNGHYHIWSFFLNTIFSDFFVVIFTIHEMTSENEWKNERKQSENDDDDDQLFQQQQQQKKNLFNSRSSSNGIQISFLSCILSFDQYWKIWKFFLFNTHSSSGQMEHGFSCVVQQQQQQKYWI